jgi:hypothetical protein
MSDTTTEKVYLLTGQHLVKGLQYIKNPQKHFLFTQKKESLIRFLFHGNRILSLLELVDQRKMNVRKHTSARNCGFNESVEFIIRTDGKQQVAGIDAFNVHIFGSITGKLQQLSGQILQNGGTVNSGSGSDTTSRMGTILQKTMDPSDGELH